MDTTIRLFWVLENHECEAVYQNVGLARVADDYEEMVAFYEEVHNALRTLWRRRGVRWLAPLAAFFDEEDDTLPDIDVQET